MKLCEVIALRHMLEETRLASVAILPETTNHLYFISLQQGQGVREGQGVLVQV